MNNKYHSVQIKFDNYRSIKHQVLSVGQLSSTIFIDTIQLNKYPSIIIGEQVEILFEFDHDLLFLTEIAFDNQPTMIINGNLTDMTTTNCPTSK